ncbi:MAG TPA: hypothetical protein VGL37_05780 [Solirubrobacteraceae bacterium]
MPTVLDCPRDFVAEFVRPAQSFEVSLFGGGDLSLAEHLPRVRVDGRKGMGALVDVHADHDHPYVLSIEDGPPADSSEWGRLPRSYQVTP